MWLVAGQFELIKSISIKPISSSISYNTVRALQVERYSNKPGARVVGFGGGGEGVKIFWGGRLRSRDQTPLECFSNLVTILLQILCYPPLV